MPTYFSKKNTITRIEIYSANNYDTQVLKTNMNQYSITITRKKHFYFC